MIIIRPKNGNPKHNYPFAWCEGIIEKAKEKNRTFIDIQGETLTKKNVEKALLDETKCFVHFIGHGKPDCYLADSLLPIIKAGENDHLLRNKDVYALSCYTTKVLGISAISNGAKNYLGYEHEYGFVYNRYFNGNPVEDTLAIPFMECSNCISFLILDGKTMKVAWEESQKEHQKWIDKLDNSKNPDAPYIIPVLLRNKKHQILHIGSQ